MRKLFQSRRQLLPCSQVYQKLWHFLVLQSYGKLLSEPPKAIGFILGTQSFTEHFLFFRYHLRYHLFNSFENSGLFVEYPQLQCLFNVVVFYRLSFIYYIYW